MMSFYSLAAAVSLAVWFLAFAGAVLLRLLLMRLASAGTRRWIARPGAVADLLFTFHTLPLSLALILTLGFALPAFLRYEPRAPGEMTGASLWLLSAAGALVLLTIAWRAIRMLRATAQVERLWRAHSRQGLGHIVIEKAAVYCVDSASPLLAVTGFFRPRIFVAREIVNMLSPGELRAAVAHELDHARRFDNLKQFLWKMMRPALRSRTEDVLWSRVSEVAADEGALARGASAVDLAGALVKIAALQSGPVLDEQIAASHLIPDLPISAFEARVVRLTRALETGARFEDRRRLPWRTIGLLAFLLFAYAAAVSTTLPAVHELLELLVH